MHTLLDEQNEQSLLKSFTSIESTSYQFIHVSGAPHDAVVRLIQLFSSKPLSKLN